MAKKVRFFEEAQQMYVQEGLTLAEISRRLDVSKTSLSYWKRDGDWGNARTKYLSSERHFADLMNQIKYNLAKKLLEELQDSEKAANPQNIYSLATLIRALKPYSAIEIKKMEEERKRELTPEERQQIIDEALESIYGIKPSKTFGPNRSG